MPYRTLMDEVPGIVRRISVGIFDFRGRSTRTELFLFAALIQPLMTQVLTLLAESAFGLDLRGSEQVETILRLVLTIPLIGIFVRRLHDQNRSGWWAAIWPLAILSAIFSTSGKPTLDAFVTLPKFYVFDVSLLATIITALVFSFWPPTEGANRFGPNPRLNDDGPAFETEAV